MRRMRAALCAVAVLASAAAAEARPTVWNQGFESSTAGWFDQSNGWAGTATRVSSGTNGIASASGGFHAIFTQTNTAAAGGTSGAFSRFDGYRTAWPGGMTASVAIYLDVAMAAGEGFDYSVAANRQNNSHLRDFIFHVSKDVSTNKLLVGGSNNTNFDPRQDLETINHAEIAQSGWYTFEHVFRDAGDGTLAVDLNLRTLSGTLLFSETRNAAADVIATLVGGNRYAWFTNIDVTGGIAVDNHMLSVPIPLPAGGALAAVGLAGLAARRRRAMRA